MDDNFYDVSPSLNHQCTMDTSWIGSSIVIKANGENIFVNESLDSILIKTQASLNDTWIMYQYTNGNYIEATIIASEIDTFFSIPDSAKKISLQLKDNMGVSLNSSYNGHQITISKSFGLTKTLSFREFPAAYFSFELMGIEGQVGYQNFKTADIYDFNIGDIFQYYSQYSTLNCLQTSNIQHTILSKTYSANLDSITYVIDDSTWFDNDCSSTGHTANMLHSVITQIIDLSQQYNGLDVLPKEVSQPDNLGYNSFGEQLMTSIYNSRPLRNEVYGLTIDSYYLCGGFSFNPGYLWCSVNKFSYVKGLGKVLEENVNPYATRICEWHLSYFKKGAETWGTPVNLNILSNTELEKRNFALVPNPTTGKLKIKNEVPIAIGIRIETIHVYNIFGREVMTLQSTDEIDLSSLAEGIYIVDVLGKDFLWRGKVIKH